MIIKKYLNYYFKEDNHSSLAFIFSITIIAMECEYQLH